jgi:hypothetical protein
MILSYCTYIVVGMERKHYLRMDIAALESAMNTVIDGSEYSRIQAFQGQNLRDIRTATSSCG